MQITIIAGLILFVAITFIAYTHLSKNPIYSNYKKIKIILIALLGLGIAVSPIFIKMYLSYQYFSKKEIKGTIIYIKSNEDSKGTSFLVGLDSAEISLGFRAIGIEVGDSFFKPPNSFQSQYKFFKKDSSNDYREIEWEFPNENGISNWKYK